jgi:hypothetical protein
MRFGQGVYGSGIYQPDTSPQAESVGWITIDATSIAYNQSIDESNETYSTSTDESSEYWTTV